MTGISQFPRAAALLTPLILILSGCAVGPNFERPLPPNIANYESTPLPAKTVSAPVEGGKEQTFVAGQAIPAEWWKLFRSQPLNDLIELSLKNSPDLAAADAALRQAYENAAAGYGVLLPSVDAGFGAQRQKISSSAAGGSGSIPAFTVINASVSTSYVLDIFGGNRRQIEGLEALEDFQRYQLEAARLSLTTNVVTTAIAEANLRGQINATKLIISEEQKVLDVLENQLELGAIAKSSVLTQRSALAQARATLPPLEKELAQTRHQLSVLAGQFPSDEPKGKFELSSLALPESLPVTLPSQLVQQRPDVRAAEASLHVASAQIGVATANMLPQFTLSADIGSIAATIGSLFAPGTGIWSLAAGVAQPIFHGGELLHKRNAAEAGYDQAAAQYRKTVLVAFQDVADALRAMQSDAEALKAQAEAERAARESLSLATQQYKDGSIRYIDLLTSQRDQHQALIGLVNAQARRYADTAALFAALGGGWWNKPVMASESPSTVPVSNYITNNGQTEAEKESGK